MVTTTEFLRKVKSAALVPTHQITYQDSDILDLANEEMDNLIVPFITAMREEFFVVQTTIPIVAGVAAINIPERAVGRTIRNLNIMITGDNRPKELIRASLSETFALNTNPDVPVFHYFQGDQIMVNPVPASNYGNYLLWWEMRPNRLVPVSDVGIISSVSNTSVTVQQNLNKAITTGSIVDVYKTKNGYSNIYYDAVVGSASTGMGAKVLVLSGFSAGNPITGVSIGDNISLAWQGSTIQLPDEAVVCLVQATALRMLQGQEQANQYSITKGLLDRNLNSLQMALTPRNEGQALKIRVKHPSFGPGRRFSIFGVASN